MKKLLMLIAMLTALLMLAGMAAAEETLVQDSSVHSVYADDTGAYVVETEWGNDGFFYMSAMFNADDGSTTIWSVFCGSAFDSEFDYSDAYCARVAVDLDDEALSDAETLYEDGVGHIALEGDVLTWTNTTDDWQVQLGLVSTETEVNYQEENNENCFLTATMTGETGDEMQVSILRESETALELWIMNIVWDDAKNIYTYTEGEYACYSMTGEITEAGNYLDGTGTFALMDDLSLVWTSSNHNDNGEMHFVIHYIDLAE